MSTDIKIFLIKFSKIPIYLIIIPFIIIVRIIRPLIFIRFGKIHSYIIGHFIADTEYYLNEKKLQKIKSIDFFYYYFKYTSFKNPPNEQWDLMVRRKLFINPLIKLFHKVNDFIPGGDLHKINMPLQKTKFNNLKLVRNRILNDAIIDKDDLIHINFTNEEIQRGENFLKDIGVKSEDKFVCLLVRDSAYKDKFQNWRKNWAYHNYRDSDIEDYKLMVSSLVKKGYRVFRMGKVVNNPLDVSHPFFIDYANSDFRSDFLDIWLMANCYFCVTTGCGIDTLCRNFMRPMVLVNFLPINTIPNLPPLNLSPKTLLWESTGERLCLSESIRHSYIRTELYKDAGILIKNLSSV